MKKILLVPTLIILLLCLSLTPIIAGTQPTFAAYNPVEKVSLTPFVHIQNSNVTNLYDGIGYVDSTTTITNGVLSGTYTNTTENQTSTITNYNMRYISIYGASQLTITNTNNMTSVILNVYDSAQLTIINSTINIVYAFNSSTVTIKDRSNITNLYVCNESQASLLTAQTTSVLLYNRGSFNANNSNITNFYAYDFSTATVNGNSRITNMYSYSAANVTVNNSTVSSNLLYGFVCTGGSLKIMGSLVLLPAPGNYRNTTTLINGSYPTPRLRSVTAFGSSQVTISNNASLYWVEARESSSVTMEGNIGGGLTIYCYDQSSMTIKDISSATSEIFCTGQSKLILQNILNAELYVYLFGQSSAEILNTTTSYLYLELDACDQSSVVAKHITLNDGTFIISGFDSSVVNIMSVESLGSADIEFTSADLSSMSISDSIINYVGYSLKSSGSMAVNGTMVTGSYTITTSWENTTIGNLWLASLAIVGSDTLTIQNSTTINIVCLHDSGKLYTQNSTITAISMRGSSSFSGNKTIINNLRMVERSSASLSNVTITVVYAGDSVTLICSGSTEAPTSISTVNAYSSLENVANVTISSCTVTNIYGVTWVRPVVALNLLLFVLPLYVWYMSTQNQFLRYAPFIVVGVAIAVVVGVGLYFWKRKA